MMDVPSQVGMAQLFVTYRSDPAAL
jgi:hypothetical protein